MAAPAKKRGRRADFWLKMALAIAGFYTLLALVFLMMASWANPYCPHGVGASADNDPQCFSAKEISNGAAGVHLAQGAVLVAAAVLAVIAAVYLLYRRRRQSEPAMSSL
jgi:hypothetical protein